MTAILAPALSAGAGDERDLNALSLEELLNMRVAVASRTDEKAADAAAVITVITQDELRRFGGTTLKDVLERAAGLIGSSIYMTDRSTIAPRGDQIQPSSSHVLFLINGRPVREALEGGIKSELYETFPLVAVERIEIIKGPGSVLYGSNAFSAVINVVTRTVEGNSVTLNAHAGEAGAYASSGAATVKAGEFELLVAGRYSDRGDWDTGYTLADPATSGTFEQRVSIPDKGPGAFLDASYKGLRLMATYNRWDNAYFLPDFGALGDARWEKLFTDLGYTLQPTSSWEMDLNFTYTRSKFEVSAFPDVKRDSFELLGEWLNFVNFANTKLTFGGLVGHTDGEETFYGAGTPILITDGNRDSYALYAQVDHRLTTWLSVIGGAQLNKIEGIDADLVPRAGIIWRPASRVAVKALYSEAFRSPSINETSLNHPLLQGNPLLEPEKVATFDFSVGYQDARTEAAVNYFFARQSQTIFQNRSAEVAFYDNIGEVDIQGVELEAKRYLGTGFYASASLLLQRSEDENGVRDLAPVASVGAKLGISYRSRDGLTVSLFDVYQGDLDERYDTALNPSPGAFNLLSLHCSVPLARVLGLNGPRQLDLFVHGDNLLDEELWLPAWGLAPGSSMPYERGRTLYAGLNLSL